MDCGLPVFLLPDTAATWERPFTSALNGVCSLEHLPAIVAGQRALLYTLLISVKEGRAQEKNISTAQLAG